MNSLALLLATALLAAASSGVSATDFVCPEPYGFYENPDNCIKYYQCTDDIAQEQICGLREYRLAFMSIRVIRLNLMHLMWHIVISCIVVVAADILLNDY